jgi:hypothetical protein
MADDRFAFGQSTPSIQISGPLGSSRFIKGLVHAQKRPTTKNFIHGIWWRQMKRWSGMTALSENFGR